MQQIRRLSCAGAIMLIATIFTYGHAGERHDAGYLGRLDLRSACDRGACRLGRYVRHRPAAVVDTRRREAAE